MRLEIEQIILVSYLNQYMSNELEQALYEDEVLPFELFKTNRTNKLVAKAIYNLQCNNIPIRDFEVYDYISKFTSVNQDEWLNLLSKCDTSFNLMLHYTDRLKQTDEDEKKMEILRSMV